jgi:dolichol-phosphate mannosyltransferase
MSLARSPLVQKDGAVKLSVVIPCYNEQNTLKKCVDRVLSIGNESLLLEIVIVDDHSTDHSLSIARDIGRCHPEVSVLTHKLNMGKGAALRTGFKVASGDFVAVQDADLEYDPMDFKMLLRPLIENRADVVLGSRFMSTGAHRVLYFWHYMGNKFLTFLSNMFTDLNLTDMETCYKVFRKDVIQAIEIQENRFGFEPEIVAKIAHMRLRVFEMGISYYGRTYEEGKKIGVKDGFRAIYCIMRYNLHHCPIPIQFFAYFIIGWISALVNLASFMFLYHIGSSLTIATATSFFIAAACNYLLCILILFRHKARWSSSGEIALYLLSTGLIGLLDLGITISLVGAGVSREMSKIAAIAAGFILNFAVRRYIVFPESSSGPWRPQMGGDSTQL